jgi:hypothetical protein
MCLRVAPHIIRVFLYQVTRACWYPTTIGSRMLKTRMKLESHAPILPVLEGSSSVVIDI